MRKLIRDGLIVFGLGVSYYIWLCLTGIGIPCVFRRLSGIRCPGCGLTTMCINIIHFDFVSAYHANKFAFCSWPVLLLGIVYQYYLNEKHLQQPKWYKLCCIGYVVAFLMFGVIRNII